MVQLALKSEGLTMVAGDDRSSVPTLTSQWGRWGAWGAEDEIGAKVACVVGDAWERSKAVDRNGGVVGQRTGIHRRVGAFHSLESRTHPGRSPDSSMA
eukprot:288670-Rhodomonas_salina.1